MSRNEYNREKKRDQQKPPHNAIDLGAFNRLTARPQRQTGPIKDQNEVNLPNAA
jgi:hypothetical protein